MTRLPGWRYAGPDPDGFMTRRPRSPRYLDRLRPRPSTPRSSTAPTVRVRAPGRRRLRRRTPSRRVASARNVVVATGWCDQPRVPAVAAGARPRRRPAHPDRLPQPGRRCPTAACWSSAPRRPACRSPTSSPAPVATSCSPSAATAGCRAATAAWTSGGGSTGSAPSPHDRRGRTTRPRRATRAPLQLVGRDDHRDVDLPALQRLGVRLAGRLTGVDGTRLSASPTTSRATTAAADERLASPARPASTTTSRATGLDAEVLPADRPLDRLRATEPRRRGSTSRADGISHGGLGHRLPPRLPVAAAAGPRRPRRDRAAPRRHPRRRALRPRPALPAPPRLQLHRRCPPRRRLRRRPHRPAGTAAASRTASLSREVTCHEPARLPPRRRRRRRPRRRRGHRHAARPRRPRRPRRRPQPLRQPTPCRPTRSCAAVSSQLHRWGLLDAVVDAGTPAGAQRPRSRYGDDVVPIADQARARRRRPLRAPPHRARPDPRRRRPRAPAPTCEYGTTVTGVTRDGTGRVDGVAGRDPTGAAVRHARPLGRRRRRHPLGRRRRRRRAGRAARHGRHRRRLRLLARASTSTGTSGSSGPTPAPGASRPTTARRACSSAATPARSAAAASTSSTSSSARRRPPSADELAHGTPRRRRAHLRRASPATSGVPWGPGWALVGDAGYWKDPISAHGLTDALRDAELLARAVIGAAPRRGHRGRRLRRLPPHPRPSCRCPCSTSSTRRRPCAGPTPRSSTSCSGLSSVMTDEVDARRPPSAPSPPRSEENAMTVALSSRHVGTLLGVWAHPDDEAYLSAGLMALARRGGERVVVVTATAGEHGTDDPDPVAAGPPRPAPPTARWPPAWPPSASTSTTGSATADGELRRRSGRRGRRRHRPRHRPRCGPTPS